MPNIAPNVYPPWRRWLYRAGIALGLALFLYQVVQGWSVFRAADACLVRPGYLGLALALYTVGYGVLMAAWGVIMAGQGVVLGPRAIAQGYMLTALPRYIPGSVWGYLSRNEWLARNHGVGYGVATLTSIMEAGLQLLSAVALAATLLTPAPWTLLVAALGLAAVWLAWIVTPVLWARLGGRPASPATYTGWWWAAVLYAVFWTLQGGALLAVHHALCAAAPLSLGHSIAAAALAWAAGFLVLFVPAGLGVREWTLTALLAPLAGIAAGHSHLLAVTCRVLLVLAELIALGFGLQGTLRAWWSKRNGVVRNLSLK
jgi:hypothetical protein